MKSNSMNDGRGEGAGKGEKSGYGHLARGCTSGATAINGQSINCYTECTTQGYSRHNYCSLTLNESWINYEK